MSASVSINGHRPMSLDDEFPGWEDEFGFPDEPRLFTPQDFDDLLMFATKKGASDITLQTEEPVTAYIEGRNLRLTRRALNSNELEMMTNYIYDSGGVGRLRASEDIDTRHTVVLRRPGEYGGMEVFETYGYRVNITACQARGDDNGISITARTIKARPPRLSEQFVEQGIIDGLYPEQGMVLICGQTGSGKSTLLAGTIVSILENPNSHKKILTLESPIEYTYDEIRRASSMVAQHEIPRHLKSFARGVRNSLRRAPKIILVGESRDAETVEASLEASQTGHTLYTTVHTNSVPATISRMANMFKPNERMVKVFEIIEATRMCVVQKLVPRADGKGRIALREFLVFDQTVRDQLRVIQTLRDCEHALTKLVEKRGQSMLTAAQRAFDSGLISRDEVIKVERESKADLMDELSVDF